MALPLVMTVSVVARTHQLVADIVSRPHDSKGDVEGFPVPSAESLDDDDPEVRPGIERLMQLRSDEGKMPDLPS